jgi:hypothetical protein
VLGHECLAARVLLFLHSNDKADERCCMTGPLVLAILDGAIHTLVLLLPVCAKVRVAFLFLALHVNLHKREKLAGLCIRRLPHPQEQGRAG